MNEKVDNQEAVKLEAADEAEACSFALPVRVECSIYEGMEASLVPVDFLAGGRTIAHFGKYRDAVTVAEAVNAHGTLTPAKLDAPDNQEALAGDDRNGVEGTILLLEALAGDCENTDGWEPAALTVREASRLIATLSRTPSSPQADVADVERAKLTERAERFVREQRSPGGFHKAADLVADLLSTMTTRPAGVEEVGDRARRLLAAQFAKEYREDVPQMETVPLQAALRAIAAALSSLPVSGEVAKLRELSDRATAGQWELYDGCSWRRIGVLYGDDCAVLYPTTCHHDGHPDLSARGGDLYANLRFIVAAVNYVRAALTPQQATEERV